MAHDSRFEETADVGDELGHVTGFADNGLYTDGSRSFHRLLVRVIGVECYENIRSDVQYLLRKVCAGQT